MTKLIFFCTFLMMLAGCHSAGRKEAMAHKTAEVSVRHARGFTIRQFAGYTRIDVRNPWDTTHTLATYILVPKGKSRPQNLPEGVVVEVPVTKAAVCTAVHAGIWKRLGELQKIKAVCEPQYIALQEIKQGVSSGKITDLGLATSIDPEKLIAVSPDILIVSPFENTSYGRLEKTGVVVVQDASYMEDSPLARAEWVKFEAAFAGKDSLAEAIFSRIEKRYTDLCSQVSKTTTRPTVFTELKYGQVWYVPGGNSYMGQFLKDAGARYLWSDVKQSGSVPLSFESVYEKAEKADFWLVKYNNPTGDFTYQQLEADYKPYTQFSAFRNKHIFYINSGKNTYYDDGPMEPEVILADLVRIFHPELLPNHQMVYYAKMK